MLAHAEDLNVLHDDHLVVALSEYGAIDDVPDVLLVALGEEQHGLRVPFGSGQQSLSVGVFAHAFQDRPDRGAHLSQALVGLLLGLLEAFSCAAAGLAEAVEVDHWAWGAGHWCGFSFFWLFGLL